MTITIEQRIAFATATGFWNCGPSVNNDVALDNCVAEPRDVVATHETLADFTASRGRPQEVIETPAGTLHVWRGVQMRRGRARGDMFAMFFGDIAASYFTGQA